MKKTTQKFRLLLADDDLDDCEIFHSALQKVNAAFTLDLFHNGKSLLEYLRNTDSELPHIVFLDLNMPLMNGLEVLREMRNSEKLRDIPVAVYSTSSSAKDVEDTLAGGANVYITKPPSLKRLQEVLQRVLEINWQYHSSGLNKDNYYFVL